MHRVFITGGAGGIGSAIVERFRRSGSEVTAPGRRELDLSDRASIDRYFQDNEQSPDAIVYCAGINDPKPLERLAYEDVDRTLAVNVVGAFGVLQHLVPAMKRRGSGSIVLVSSIYGHISRQGRLAYAMSKHALNAMVKTLALELGSHQILVNAVSPGFVETALTWKNNSPEVVRSIVGKIPLGRMAKPEDIAEIAHFLCSPANRYVTGQCLIADGGYSIGGFEK